MLHDSHGEPYTVTKAICIHEEDDGILWKHVDDRTGAEMRRMRRLVVSFHATVANYEYLVYWRFHQDGNIECEVRATGIMVTTPFADGPPPYGTVIDQRTYASFHQHFIVARLDLDVDGEANTVLRRGGRCRCRPAPTTRTGSRSRNKLDAAQIRARGHPGLRLGSASGAGRCVNDNVANGLGTPVGYKLEPTAAIPPLIDPESPVCAARSRDRAQAVGHALQPTHERWPCGEFPNLSLEDSGLPVWTAADRPIENTDVVLWYVFGINHVTRPEDWPVMPVDTVSFWLKPFGFFDRNPALDVPGHDPAHPPCLTT